MMEDWSNNPWLLKGDDEGFHVDDCVYEEDEISYAVDDDDLLPWEQHVERVHTATGVVQVTVCGDRANPPLITYHDVGLNHSTCFQGLMLCADTSSLLLRNFCVFHVDAPGHEEDAEEIPSSQPLLSADDLAEQVAEVARHFALAEVTLLGVTAGAYVLTLFALSHPHLVRGLILVSPLLSAPSWSEWAYNKVTMNVLSYYGMTSYIKDSLFDRYFCPARWGFHGPASDALMSFRRELDYHEPENLMRYFYAIQRRRNLLPLLSSLQVPVLLAVGDMSPFNLQARTAFHHLRAKVSAGPSESKLKWEDEKESGVEEEEEEGGNARGRRGREKQAAAVSRDHQGGAVGDRVRRRGGRICEWRECEERGGNDGVALAGEDQVGRGSEEGWTGGAERDWEREQESESQGSSTRMEDWQKGGGCVLWVEVEACGSLVTEERPHTLFPSLCRFVAKLRPTQYQQWQQWQQLPAAQWSLAPCPFQRGATDAEASGGLAEERGKVEGEAQEGEQDRQQQNQLQQWQRVHRQQQVHSTAPLLRDRSHREAPFCIPLFSQHLTQEQHQEKQQQHREKQQQQQQQSSVVQSSQAWPSHTSKAANLVCTIPSPITSHPLKSPSLSGSQLPSPSSIPPLISPSTSTPSTCTPSVTTPSTSAQSVCTPSARTPLFWTPGSTPADLSPARMLPPSAVNHPPLVNRSGSVSEAGLVALLLPSEAGAAGKGVGKQMLSRGCRCVGVPGSEVEGLRSGEEVSGEREQLLRLECERARLRPVRIHGVARRWEEVVPQTGFEMCGSPTS
ncbi:hypothetical protein CLOM_g19746 [Closterium sp. NIES-68]|nr:hypothetical protein CLOM_g19746 [Closterium sp. NIES-68]GJP83809.1 hypothetical protein CLOP_g13911 [Closterium sp. NIES-67]